MMRIVKGFRPLPSKIISSRQVVAEISDLVPGSNVQQCGRPSAAVIKKPVRKRVTSDERKAMLESFVNKYREMNLGKFPTVKGAQKEVGGSFYSIRKMLQELAYNSKISSVEKGLVKENDNEYAISSEITIESSSGSEDVSDHQITMDQLLYKDACSEPVSNFDANFKLKEGFQPSTSGEEPESSSITRDETHNIATDTHTMYGPCQEKTNHNVREDFPLEDSFDDSNPKVEQRKPAVTRNITRDMTDSQMDDKHIQIHTQKQKKSLWGDLKSLASGFIGLWRKQ